jgi:Aspartyl protease
MILSRRQLVQSFPLLGLPAPLLAQRGPIEARMVVEDGRLWVGAQIGDKALRFVVDTGAAGNFIRPEIAKSLGLTNISVGGTVSGVGGKSSVVGNVEAKNVVIGGVVRQPRMQFSTYNVRIGGDDSAGLLAAGLVTAYDSDLLLGDTMATWRIWLDGRTAVPEGKLLEGAMIRKKSEREASERIVVTAMIDGKPYRLMVDTGAPRSLLLFAKATARSGLWDASAWAPQRLRGFGGAADRLARITRATRLDFGPLALKRPFVTLTDPGQAAFGDLDGLIGLPIITLFDWSIDADKNRIWLKRNVRKAGADFYGRSGLWLKREADGSATVEAVGAGSPAAAAGVTVGMRVPGFLSLLPRTNGDAGSTVEIGGKTVTLADYL